MSIIRFRCPQAAGGSYSPSLVQTIAEAEDRSNIGNLRKTVITCYELAVHTPKIQISATRIFLYGEPSAVSGPSRGGGVCCSTIASTSWTAAPICSTVLAHSATVRIRATRREGLRVADETLACAVFGSPH